MSYFLNTDEIVQTIRMIEQEHLDVRTITLGLSLLDCATGDIKRTADKVYEKICREAQKATEPEVKEASADENEMEEEI